VFSRQVALVVDDSKQVLELVARMLRNELGFGEVLTATSGQQALTQIRSQRVDWVFSDWEMAGMSGYDLLVELRNDPDTTDLPFIMMTSRADRESLLAAVSAGVSDYIAKPFTPATLQDKLRRLVHLRERRDTIRVTPGEDYVCTITFGDAGPFRGTVINLSQAGCLLRTELLRGGCIYDMAELELQLGPDTVKVRGELVRTETDRDDSGAARETMRAAFRLADIGREEKTALNRFIHQNRVPASDDETA
jgi:CheY-like chemotaxis protein